MDIMDKNPKIQSNPFSTGGGGHNFETSVQSCFVLLMLCRGLAPCINIPIKKIKLQGKYNGYETDDLIIFSDDSNESRKLICQIKHSIKITESDSNFQSVIQSAWKDFNNEKIFKKRKDAIALITGPLSKTDINNVRPILERAREVENADEFYDKLGLTGFSSKEQREKFQIFQSHLKKANEGKKLSKEDVFEFIKHFHIFGCDLDIKNGFTLSLVQTMVAQYNENLWEKIINEVRYANQNAGTITYENFSEEIKEAFSQRSYKTFPVEFLEKTSLYNTTEWNSHHYATQLAIFGSVNL
jgi:hypothetical protein